ncbi:hypothetical protein B5M09_004801 [Aphanomyces astaci]|uniref:Uncharacterized protein n=1 Tax=Aphanomyces astaci TaxID=112090 RepID=A0A425D0S4_APHAT|nr:hypothetical protein B5M09_004801 [Aphanomyces astaci]
MQLRAFEAWIRQHGGRIGNVQLAAFPGMGIGVQTTSDITEKDEVLYLPRDLVMYVRWVRVLKRHYDTNLRRCRDTVTKQLPREFLRTGPHADDDLLATFLLLERLKGPASKWAPYLALIGDAKRSTTAAFKALLRKLSAVLKKRKASLSLVRREPTEDELNDLKERVAEEMEKLVVSDNDDDDFGDVEDIGELIKALMAEAVVRFTKEHGHEPDEDTAKSILKNVTRIALTLQGDDQDVQDEATDEGSDDDEGGGDEVEGKA